MPRGKKNKCFVYKSEESGITSHHTWGNADNTPKQLKKYDKKVRKVCVWKRKEQKKSS